MAQRLNRRIGTVGAALLLPLALAACSLFGVRDGYEQPRYEVVETLEQDVEIRRYAPRLAAEATVETDDLDKGTNAAFRLLFDYISGANLPQAEIAMTAPVAVAEEGAKIAMTAPVETKAAGEKVTMRFFLPSSFSAETAPQPSDPRVRLVTLPEETVAALRYSGLRDEEREVEKDGVLRAVLAGSQWRPDGEALAYYYDPPWTLPWLRRNEAIVPVARR